ncbi:MAG: response regulator transcription factor [Agriterribacter sp.]
MLNILIAEDHPVVRMGVSILLKDMYNDLTVSEVDTADLLFSSLDQQNYDLLLLDINIPGGNSAQILKPIRSKQPGIRILVFSSFEEDTYAVRYLKAGADGYVQKESPPEEIKKAIQKVLNHEIYTSDLVQQQMLKEMAGGSHAIGDISNLSDRELEIMNLLVKGLSSSEIKILLNIELSTISTYKARLFSKMGVSNVVKLVEKVNAIRLKTK